MSIKKLISFIILILIIILLVFGIFYLLKNRTPKDGLPKEEQTNEFPSSGSSGNNGFTQENNRGDANIILLPGQILDGEGGVVEKRDIKLRQISTEPTAGFSIDQKEITIERETEVLSEDSEEIEYSVEEVEIQEYLTYFIQKKDGHIILDSDNESDQKKISNTTIPQTYLGYVSKDFSILQYLDGSKEVIRSFAGIFKDEKKIEKTENEEGEIIENEVIEKVFEGLLLPNDLKSLVLSPDKSTLAFIIETITGSDIVTMKSDDFTDVKILYKSQLTDISIQWGNNNTIYITSKPDSRAPGFVKEVDTRTGESATILSGIFGLTTKPSYDNKYHIVTGVRSIEEGSSPLFIFNKTNNSYIDTKIYSLPEKCVWSSVNTEIVYCLGQRLAASGELPQDWYQGKTNFADLLFKINVETSEIENVSSSYAVDIIFDGIKPQLSPDEKRLIFIDKNDDTPWILTLD